MDQNAFDDLTRALARGTSRRQALKLLGGSLAGGLLAVLGVGEAAADDTCKPIGKKCKKNSQCCSGNCANGTCAPTCPSANVCGSTCLTAPCDANQCLTCDPTSGTCASNCTSDQTCSNGVCCASGKVGLSNGTCATPCNPFILGSCGVGCNCIRESSGTTFCAGSGTPNSCETTRDCPPGQFCTLFQTGGLCATTCSA
jgi:hypothetical protein